MRMVPRADWGARPPRYRNTGNLNQASTEHWNGLKVTVKGEGTWAHDKCAGLVRGIQNFHMDGQGWSDIAYNFVICPHGYTFEGRGLNVINGANGTNTGNQTSHAVMVLAGQDNPFPNAEKVAFKETVWYISNTTTAPNKAIGHRDHKSTECPGNERYNWIHQGMPVTGEENGMATLDNDDKMAIAIIVRDQLNAGTGVGQTSWAATNKAILSTVQDHTNKLNTLIGRSGVSSAEIVEALRPIIVQTIEESIGDSGGGATPDQLVDKIVERLQT